MPRLSRPHSTLASVLLLWCLASSILLASAKRKDLKLVLVLSAENHSARDETNPSEIDEGAEEPFDWDEFGSSRFENLDPGSWQSLADVQAEGEAAVAGTHEVLYETGVHELLSAVSEGDPTTLRAAVQKFQQAADGGNAHAQSSLAFLYGCGSGVAQSDAKSYLYHSFAAEGRNFQSKMALAYKYLRQQMIGEAVQLYAELAGTAIASFATIFDSPLIEDIPLSNGLEENKELLRSSRGEDNDDFQILEYQARKGNAGAMTKVGLFYYSGVRGVHRNHKKALFWFLKAAEKGDVSAMELLGEIYAGGHGVEQNFTKAFEWFQAASRHKRFSAYNGIGYLYVKGQGVVERNYTMAQEFFRMAAEHNDPDGHYNLGVLYLKGKGVRKDVNAASKHFVDAANRGHSKAFYQLGKLYHKGGGVKRNLAMAVGFYKIVAERGPWGSLMRWALESYLKKDVGKALLLYSRAAELGYEVAQSNAAWILQKFTEEEYCIGESNFCSPAERHQRAHTLWWHASEQGNDAAALLIGDAYYYGRGTEEDLERAAGAYKHAGLQSNAQAIFNLGYMHEHDEGLPLDLHLAKRYYDEALKMDPDAALPVYLALARLWLRQHYNNSILIKLIDILPQLYFDFWTWLKGAIMDEGNVTVFTLLVCLIMVLSLYTAKKNCSTSCSSPTVIGSDTFITNSLWLCGYMPLK